MKIIPAIFEEREIRRLYDEKTETWFFSVVDIVQALTQQPDYKAARNYWKVLKNRLAKEGSQLVTNCNQLKLPAADGKKYVTDVANAETLLRLVQSVPSPKAEPIKLWLAKVGYERMQEMSDPALSLERARATWQKHGRSEKWIQQRMTGQETRNKLTDYWAGHDIKKGDEYAILTNLIHQEWSGVSVKGSSNHHRRASPNKEHHLGLFRARLIGLAQHLGTSEKSSPVVIGPPSLAPVGLQSGCRLRRCASHLTLSDAMHLKNLENLEIPGVQGADFPNPRDMPSHCDQGIQKAFSTQLESHAATRPFVLRERAPDEGRTPWRRSTSVP
jgi:hypothetical protein